MRIIVLYFSLQITAYGGKLTYKIETEAFDKTQKLPGSDVILVVSLTILLTFLNMYLYTNPKQWTLLKSF